MDSAIVLQVGGRFRVFLSQAAHAWKTRDQEMPCK